ncbi:MAG: hypothetical protein JWO98_2342 [Frankiales bacterium]|nr:hypothetical protein [Frankiales bacterium]
MTARHLRLVDPAQAAQPVTPQAARAAVVALGQKYDLELFDALLALTAAHDDPAAAIRDLQDLRRNAVHVTGYVFDNVISHYAQRQRCAQ